MIAYNKTGLDNIQILNKAKSWFQQRLLSKEQFEVVENQFENSFYMPNIFVKIGLFLFTIFLVFAAIGLYALTFSNAFDSSSNFNAFYNFSSILFTTICFAVLEFLIKNPDKQIYRSGMDEALLYLGTSFFFSALVSIFKVWDASFSENVGVFIIMAPFLFAATVRYADKLITTLFTLCIYVIVFLMILKLGAIAKLIMPFCFMIISVIIYTISEKHKSKEALRFWSECFTTLQSVALVIFYLAGNYFVIREASINYFGLQIPKGGDIPLAFLFYLFTAFVPLLYIFWGLRKKEKMQLWVGLVLVAISVLTFKNYFSLGHPEITLTIAGIIMILVAYFSIRYFKTPKHGITFEEDEDESEYLNSNTEAIIIAQNIGHQNEATSMNTNPEGFGGGSSGGGGAGSSY